MVRVQVCKARLQQRSLPFYTAGTIRGKAEESALYKDFQCALTTFEKVLMVKSELQQHSFSELFIFLLTWIKGTIHGNVKCLAILGETQFRSPHFRLLKTLNSHQHHTPPVSVHVQHITKGEGGGLISLLGIIWLGLLYLMQTVDYKGQCFLSVLPL